MSVLDPLSHALAAVVASAHTGLTALGADPAAGTTWVLCIAAVVVVVRTALLPVTVHAVRHARAAGSARPQLQALARKYRDRRDPDSLRAFAAERRRIATEHGMSRWAALPALAQVPIWLALYHLVASAASGSPVGAVDGGLVASLTAATVLAVPLAERGYVGGGAHLLVVAGLAVAAAALSFVTQRFFVTPNTVLTGLPDAVVGAHRWLPALSAASLLVAGGFVPVALLVYWVCNSSWTLAQAVVVWRWFPTPGSPAARRLTPG